ncbi:MAG: hypothetical protein PHT33_09560 [bacterium]|nr:hypothetical protein [bacterium]
MRLKRLFAASLINLLSITTVIGAGGEISFGASAEPVEHPLRYKRLGSDEDNAAGRDSKDSPQSQKEESKKEAKQADKKPVVKLPAKSVGSKAGSKRLTEVLSSDVVERMTPVAANMPVVYPGDRSLDARPDLFPEGERVADEHGDMVFSGYGSVAELADPDKRLAVAAAAARTGQSMALSEGAAGSSGETLSPGNSGLSFETQPEARQKGGVYVAGNVTRQNSQSGAVVDTASMQFDMSPSSNLILKGSYQGSSGSGIGSQESADIGFETGQAMRERGFFLSGNVNRQSIAGGAGISGSALRFEGQPAKDLNIRGDITTSNNAYSSSRSTNLSLDAKPVKSLLFKANYNGQSFNGMENNTTAYSLETSPEFAARSRITALGRVSSTSGAGALAQKQTELWLTASPGERLRLAADMQRSEATGWQNANNRVRADYNLGQKVQLAAEMNNSQSGSFSQSQQWMRVAAQPGNNTSVAVESVRRSYNGGENLADGRAEIRTNMGPVGVYARMNSSEISQGVVSRDQAVGLQTAVGGRVNLSVDRGVRSTTGTESVGVTGVHVKGRVAGSLEAQYGMEWIDGHAGGGSYLGLSGQPVKGVNLNYKRRLQDQQLNTITLPMQELSLTTDMFSSGSNALQVRGGVSYLQQEKGNPNWLNADMGLIYKPSSNVNLSATYRANVQGDTRLLDPGLEMRGEVRWEF